MDKFREPEQFDAEVEIHGGEPFAVWAPAVNGSHVKAEHYFALLAELEAKDERIGELEVIATEYAGKFQKAQDANKHLIIMSNDDKRRIAELDAHNECLLKKNADLTQQNIKLGERLATPVRLLGEMLVHDWEHNVERQATFQHRKIAWDARLAEDKKAILAAGFTFTVEGGE